MEHTDLCGTGVALVTPFNKKGGVDFKALETLVNHVIHGGVEYLVVMGTTGESVTVGNDEKKEIIDCILNVNNNQLPIVFGIGGYNTMEVCDQINRTDLSQINCILSVSPYYNKPNQEGIFQHYKYLSDNCNVPIILYNVPGRTGKNIEASTTLRLARECENIVAIKEASGNLTQIMSIIKDKPDHFKVISGDDAMTYPMMTLGGCGVISVIANAFPSQFANMVHFAQDDNLDEARKIHYQLLELIGLIFKEGNPAGIKAVLSILGIADDIVRLPLVPVSKELFSLIEKQVKIINEL